MSHSRESDLVAALTQIEDYAMAFPDMETVVEMARTAIATPSTDVDLIATSLALKGIVEGVSGAMEHGTFRAEKGMRLKDTPEWVAFYVAISQIGAKP